MSKKKLLILIVAYNAEKHINAVIDRIPNAIWQNRLYETEILLLDDASQDNTVAVCSLYSIQKDKAITIAKNIVNQGYGGNRKLGYNYAIQHNFDIVALLDGDGLYAPEMLEDMVAPVALGEADAVFGSRMIVRKKARADGMPLYKFLGNIILSTLQNMLLSYNLSEYHCGYRIYSVAALKELPFAYNSDGFDFDTDIIIQLIDNKMRIKELPIPTYHNDEIRYVNGLYYAVKTLWNTVLSRLQDKGLYCCLKYDYTQQRYNDKTHFFSSHSFALEHIPPGSLVMDIGCGDGYVARKLKAQGCVVHGCDIHPSPLFPYDYYLQMDLNQDRFPALSVQYDAILMGDIIEHLDSPETFLEGIRNEKSFRNAKLIITTPNIAFITMRLLLLLGQFNYTRKGIMDRTHKRLFTFHSLKKLLTEVGFVVEEMVGIPAPYPLIIKNRLLNVVCMYIHTKLIRLWKSLFSYQIAVISTPIPTLEARIEESLHHGAVVYNQVLQKTVG